MFCVIVICIYFEFLLKYYDLDGHDGLTERIDSPFPGGLSSDDAPQYSFDDACELDTITDPIPGPSRSISFITDTDNSTATKSTLPIWTFDNIFIIIHIFTYTFL